MSGLAVLRVVRSFLSIQVVLLVLPMTVDLSRALTIDDAVDRALTSKPVLRVRRAAVERARTAADVGYGWLGPTIEAEAMPHHSGNHLAGKEAPMNDAVTRVSQIAALLDQYGDGGDAPATQAQKARFDQVLDYIRSLYPAGSLVGS